MLALAMIFRTESDKHPIPFWICMVLFAAIVHSIPYCVRIPPNNASNKINDFTKVIEQTKGKRLVEVQGQFSVIYEVHIKKSFFSKWAYPGHFSECWAIEFAYAKQIYDNL
jgi:hypothetical protein